ncbi:MAG: ComF family protein [Prevotella sp.]|nr:ComF family protein [Prevotella sp.]
MKISFLSRLTDLIAPRACVACGNRLAVGEDCLCSVCNLHLPRTGFHRHAEDNPMARLLWGLMPVERATALFYYAPGTQTARIVEALKYNDQPEVGVAMGRLMGSELAESGFFNDVDVLIPVPLARSRQRQRGYNQCLMLARGVSEVTGISVVEGVIAREKFERSQTRLDRWERMENVDGLFELCDADALRGKHVVLIDDVLTTGATVCACAHALQRVGGLRISVLTLGFAKS